MLRGSEAWRGCSEFVEPYRTDLRGRRGCLLRSMKPDHALSARLEIVYQVGWESRRPVKARTLPVNDESLQCEFSTGAIEAIPVAHALRQIVAERRIDYVVDSVRRDGADGRRRTVDARVRVSAYVGILRAELESALGTVVGFDPEAERTLDDALGLTTTGADRAKIVTARARRRRQGFGVASPVSIGCRSWDHSVRSVPHRFAGTKSVNCIVVSHIVLAAIEVDIQLGIVKFKRGQTLIGAQRNQPAIGIDGGIRQTRRGVPAQTVAVEGVKAEIHVLIHHGETSVPSNSTAVLGVVIGSYHGIDDGTAGAGIAQRRGLRPYRARIHAVAEPAEDTEDFVVAEAGLSSSLDDDVRHRVEGIVGRVGTNGNGCAGGVEGGAASSDAGIVESAADTVAA